MANKPTAGQENAINAKGTVLVSAAAGSGKTFVLTERVIKLLTDKENPCDADRLLIVTFTNSAAAEMRARIEKRLNEECKKAPSNKRLLRQKILLSYSSVGTIDSFCMELVRENFYDLQIDPNYTIINENVFSDWLNGTVSEVLAEKYAAGSEGYTAMLDAIGSSFADDRLKKCVISIYKNTRTLQDPTQWLKDVAHNYSDEGKEVWYRYALDIAVEWAEHFAGIIASGIEKTTELLDNYSGKLPKLITDFCACNQGNYHTLNRFTEAARKGDWDETLKHYNGIEVCNRRGISKLTDDSIMSQIAKIIDTTVAGTSQFKKQLSDFFYGSRAEIDEHISTAGKAVSFITDIVIEVEKRLFEKCKEKGTFTFDMIEHLALSILKGEGGAEVANRYDWVLVDEYQDVNELQGTIFNYLSGNEKRLFVVGDVKQSIYGFRKADPELFLARKDSYPAFDGTNYPSKVILDANFRSRAGICEFVNFAFNRLMTRAISGMDYLAEDRLDPNADFADRKEADVEFHLINSDGKRDTLDSPRHIAAYIKKAVDEGMTVGKAGEERPARYGDFAVLMRSPSVHVDDYIEELNKLGIPVSTEKSDFWSNSEIVSLCGILSAINNPCNDVALLTLLMSYPGGFTADDVALMRANYGGKHSSVYTSLSAMAMAGEKKAVEAMEMLFDLRMVANTSTLTALINAVYERMDYVNTVKISASGESRKGNLLKLLAVASDFQKGDNADLASFCAYTERAMASSKDKSPVEPAGSDAVKIMSIHLSKGLQFPVCFISRCEAQFNYEDIWAHTVFHEKWGFATNIFNYSEGLYYQYLPKRVIAHALVRKLIAEELRLLYVAMTRAEDKLIFVANEADARSKLAKAADKLPQNGNKRFSTAAVSDSSSYANWLYMVLLSHPHMNYLREELGLPAAAECEETSRVVLNVISPEEIGTDIAVEKADTISPNEEIINEIKSRVDFVYPYEKLLKVAAKTSVSALSHEREERNELTDTPSFLSGTMLTPAQRGTALHKFMQFCDFTACENDADGEADRLEDMEFITETERDALDMRAIKSFFESELYGRIKNASSVMREQRFLSKLPVSAVQPDLGDEFSDETVVIQGAADCLFIEDGHLVVLDFKSDRVKSADELVSRYATQLDIYGKVFSEVYGMPVKEKVIYSFKLGKSVTV